MNMPSRGRKYYLFRPPGAGEDTCYSGHQGEGKYNTRGALSPTEILGEDKTYSGHEGAGEDTSYSGHQGAGEYITYSGHQSVHQINNENDKIKKAVR